ncbi:MAG: 50S ribosomal protein L23 [Patescibacteria group bacterium]|jgi:large subunit ribosomal protein L23
MGIFERFRSQKGKQEKRKHLTDQKHVADDAKKQTFKNVPSAGSEKNTKEEKPAKDAEKSSEKSRGAGSGSAGKKVVRITGSAYRVLMKPLVTEKSNDLSSRGQYLFAVHTEANKLEIAAAVEKVYGVRPRRVHVQRMRGKQVRYGRSSGVTSQWKKAIVTLPEGKSIDVFEG